ncbi:MAG: carboxypeptidase regulatory-like domain-containing protein [Candidatus Sumerlaeia bacterium]|nr:carboxypeptidase regulatory-like domain-containing protein [Candidatus Sumerlaeia bacterium]
MTGIWRLLVLGWLVLVAGAGAQDLSGLAGDDEVPRNPIRVDGIVRGPMGPAEGVRVLLELSDMRIRRPIAWLETRTDTAGEFSFDLSPWDLPEYGMEFNTVSRRFIETIRIVRVRRGELPASVELEVQPGSVARGLVVDEEDKPLEGVQIRAPGVRRQTSDEEGQWESFGLPAFTELSFYKEGYTEVRLPVRTAGPEIVEGLRVVLESARALDGEVVDWQGRPVPFALVMLKTGRTFMQRQADAKGAFQFRGVPEDLDRVILEVLARGYLPTIHRFTDEEKESQRIRVEIDSGVFVRGTVALPSGGLAAGAQVMAGRGGGAASPRSVADAEGNWRLGPFRPGEAVLFTVLPPATEGTWGIADLVLRQDRTNPGAFAGGVELWPKGFTSTFTAWVQDSTVTMSRRDKGPEGMAGEVRYSGTFDPDAKRIEGTLEVVGMMQTGTFTMRQNAGSGRGVEGEWELREEIGPSGLALAPAQETVAMPLIAGTTTAHLQLDEPLTLRGEALRADGLPFIDGTVYLHDWEGSGVYKPTARIGVGGRFEFDRIPRGTFVLVAVSGDQARQTEPMVLRGGIEGVRLYEEEPPDPFDD